MAKVEDIVLKKLDEIDQKVDLLLADFNQRKGAKNAFMALCGFVAFISSFVGSKIANLFN